MAIEYVVIGSTYTKPRDTLDRERLAAIKHIKRRRNHPKRHAVMKELCALKAAKKAESAKRKAAYWSARAVYHEQVRLYWQNLADHP
jgi:hypothetical protein